MDDERRPLLDSVLRGQGEQRIVTRAAASDGLHLSVTLLINSSSFGDSTRSIDDDGHCTVNVSHIPEIMTPLRQLPSKLPRLYQVYRIVNAGNVLLSDTEHSAPLCDVVEGFEEAFAARSAGVFGACNMLCGEMSSLWTPPRPAGSSTRWSCRRSRTTPSPHAMRAAVP